MNKILPRLKQNSRALPYASSEKYFTSFLTLHSPYLSQSTVISLRRVRMYFERQRTLNTSLPALD